MCSARLSSRRSRRSRATCTSGPRIGGRGQVELFTAEEYQELLDTSPLDAATGLSLEEINEQTARRHHERMDRVADYTAQLALPPPDTITGCLDYLVLAGLLHRTGRSRRSRYVLQSDPPSPRTVFDLIENDEKPYASANPSTIGASHPPSSSGPPPTSSPAAEPSPSAAWPVVSASTRPPPAPPSKFSDSPRTWPCPKTSTPLVNWIGFTSRTLEGDPVQDPGDHQRRPFGGYNVITPVE